MSTLCSDAGILDAGTDTGVGMPDAFIDEDAGRGPTRGAPDDADAGDVLRGPPICASFARTDCSLRVGFV